MLFSLGAVELLLLFLLAAVVGILHLGRHRHLRIGLVTLVCVAIATITTPADITSTILMSLAFGGIFTFGSRFKIHPPSKDVSDQPSDSSFMKAMLTIIAFGIVMLVIGSYYAAMNAEHHLAHQAFRSWAFSVAGSAALALGCLIGFADLVRRKWGSSTKTLL